MKQTALILAAFAVFGLLGTMDMNSQKVENILNTQNSGNCLSIDQVNTIKSASLYPSTKRNIADTDITVCGESGRDLNRFNKWN